MDESDIPEVVRKARESGGRESEAAYIESRAGKEQRPCPIARYRAEITSHIPTQAGGKDRA